jgi:hypothetical protein
MSTLIDLKQIISDLRPKKSIKIVFAFFKNKNRNKKQNLS